MNENNNIKLPDTTKLVVSSSPHFHSGANIRKIMLTVIIALLPSCIAGVIFFGMKALIILALCSITCMFFEELFCRMLKQKSSVGNLSGLLTGLLLGMNLSASTPWWACIIGSLIAIGLGKMIFGGLGYNPFNPALVGRVALLIAFPAILTTWVPANHSNQNKQTTAKIESSTKTTATPTKTKQNIDAKTCATPLGFKNAGGIKKMNISYWDCFIGRIGGCIGETSAIALLIGGLLLIYLKLIRWEIPLTFILTVAIITGLYYLLTGDNVEKIDPLYHILSGGIFLGAFFMATDMVTSPMSRIGAIIMGIGCGIITSAIRIWGSYPEGVSFSILFMNALVPLIDKYTTGKPFGTRKKQEAKA